MVCIKNWWPGNGLFRRWKRIQEYTSNRFSRTTSYTSVLVVGIQSRLVSYPNRYSEARGFQRQFVVKNTTKLHERYHAPSFRTVRVGDGKPSRKSSREFCPVRSCSRLRRRTVRIARSNFMQLDACNIREMNEDIYSHERHRKYNQGKRVHVTKKDNLMLEKCLIICNNSLGIGQLPIPKSTKHHLQSRYVNLPNPLIRTLPAQVNF